MDIILSADRVGALSAGASLPSATPSMPLLGLPAGLSQSPVPSPARPGMLLSTVAAGRGYAQVSAAVARHPGTSVLSDPDEDSVTSDSSVDLGEGMLR
jgi:hypothetical protein